MKKSGIMAVALLVFALSLWILLFQGFALPAASAPILLILRILAALSAQTFFLCAFRHPALRVAPLMLTTLLALWGGWLFLTSSAWQNATLAEYLADYCSPALVCMLVLMIPGFRKRA